MLPRLGRILPGLALCAGLTLGGCKEKDELPRRPAPGAEKKGKTEIRIPPGEQASAPKPLPRVEGADAGDDAGAPDYLPKSYEVGEWVKSERVRVGSGEQLGRVLSNEEAGRVGRFRVRRVIQCAYTWNTTAGTCTADVLVLEAETPEDAFGIVTCLCASANELPIGGLTRVEGRDGTRFHTWKGRCSIRTTCPRPIAGGEAEIRRLLTHLAGRIDDRAERPRLLAALPVQGALPGKLWLARSLQSISTDDFIIRPAPDFARIDALLGLGREAWIAVAAYQTAEGTGPDVVWVAQYATADEARDGYARYTQHLAGAADSASASTNLAPPQGHFLVGTWTAEEESMQYIIPRIQQLLPSE